MKLIPALALAACLAAPATMSALEYSWLTFRMADATELSVAADNLVMTYADGRLDLASDRVSESLEAASIRSMRFTSESVGIDAISAAASSAAEYFTSAGVSVGTFASIDDARSALPSGIYIARTGASTLKVIF